MKFQPDELRNTFFLITKGWDLKQNSCNLTVLFVF